MFRPIRSPARLRRRNGTSASNAISKPSRCRIAAVSPCTSVALSISERPIGRAVRLCNHAADGKAVPVLHERMAQIRELGLAPARLAVELGFRVGRALMRIVLA